MNKVLLVLFFVGVTIAHTSRSTEKLQIDQVENTVPSKPPELLWDPDQRMWTYDNEDFYSKDYSGDDNHSAPSDFTFLDTPENETDIIDSEEGAYNEQYKNNAPKTNCTTFKNEDQTDLINCQENVLLPVDHNSIDKSSVNNFVKFEEETSNNIDGPLSQELELVANKGRTNAVDPKPDVSRSNVEIELNPATEYPLWALDFESKRTRPLQKEIVTAKTTESDIDRKKVIAVTKLQVIPIDDQKQDSPGNTNLNSLRNSRIINIQPVHNQTLPVSILTTRNSTIENNTISLTLGRETNIKPLSTNNVSSIDLSLVNGTKAEPNSTSDVNKTSNACLECNINSSSEEQINSTIMTEIFPTVFPLPNTINGTNEIPIEQPLECSSITTTIGETTLHWPKTLTNVTTTAQEICLNKEGLPITRICLNGVWSAINGTCLNAAISPKTILLTELLNSNCEPSTLSKNLTQITTDTSNVTSYQIHLVSQLLEKLAESPQHAQFSEVAQTVNNIMHFGTVELELAQEMLNSTDKILYSLDDFLVKTNPPDNGYRTTVTEKLLVQEVNLLKTNFNGFEVETNDTNGFQANDLTVYQNTNNFNGSSQTMELALLISEELKIAIKECKGSKANPNIISTIFHDHILFNSHKNKCDSNGKVISVLLPGFNCSFTGPLQIIFRPTNISNLNQHRCSYWKYGSNKQAENIKGRWVFESMPKRFLNTTYQLCEYWHATHFSLLVLGDLPTNISETDKKALDIITAVGSGLSLLGLLAVFVTAIAFRSYRSANAVVIHFSIAMAAQILLLFIAANTNQNKLMCTIFGAALHYVVLSQFCWMLTIALLQYKRYVLVFSNPTKYLIAKACAFAWGLPLIPIIVVISISTENYTRNRYGLCYAVGNYFIFGVLIPVATIVFINLLVFLRIMIYIASRKIKAHRKMDNATSLQLRLAIMLYFLLGLTWGFGLIASIGGGVVYSYLFCITATLQGFVLFLFFIALSDKTRSLWASTLWCPCLDKKKKYDVNTDSSSHPMVRRPTSTNTSDTFTDVTNNDLFQKYKNRKSTDF